MSFRPPPQPPRRRAAVASLAGLAAALLTFAGCRGVAGPAPTAATATADAATATPARTATPRPLLTITIDPPAVGQGETLLVRVPGAAGGTLTLGGHAYPLIAAGNPAGPEAWAVAGIAIDAPLGPATLRIAPRDGAGAALAEVRATYTVVAVPRRVDELTLTPEQAAVVTAESLAREEQLRAAQFAVFDGAPRWSGVFQHPLAGAPEVTTLFGSGRSTNGGPVGGFHTGEDLAADEKTPVLAAAAGRVAWAGTMPIRGNSVLIDHGAGVITGYHHLHAITVQPGQAVAAGALLGEVGATGLATGPHLHWELTIYGVNVDPETWTTRAFRP